MNVCMYIGINFLKNNCTSFKLNHFKRKNEKYSVKWNLGNSTSNNLKYFFTPFVRF